MSALFLVCVVLQYNDPDPLRWMAIYGAAGLVCLAHSWRGRVHALIPLAVAVTALVWASLVALHIRGDFEWRHLAETMHAATPQIEKSRESLGLAIVAAWMVVIVLAERRRPLPRQG